MPAMDHEFLPDTFGYTNCPFDRLSRILINRKSSSWVLLLLGMHTVRIPYSYRAAQQAILATLTFSARRLLVIAAAVTYKSGTAGGLLHKPGKNRRGYEVHVLVPVLCVEQYRY